MSVHELFVYLRAAPAADAVAYYSRVFGAVEKFRLTAPDGRIGHAELALGGTTLMISDPFPEIGCDAPMPGARLPVSIHLHVDDADALIERAVAAGAELLRAPQDHFYGERSGAIRDPFGHEWMIGHEIEAVEPAEMQRRYDAMAGG